MRYDMQICNYNRMTVTVTLMLAVQRIVVVVVVVGRAHDGH